MSCEANKDEGSLSVSNTYTLGLLFFLFLVGVKKALVVSIFLCVVRDTHPSCPYGTNSLSKGMSLSKSLRVIFLKLNWYGHS